MAGSVLRDRAGGDGSDHGWIAVRLQMSAPSEMVEGKKAMTLSPVVVSDRCSRPGTDRAGHRGETTRGEWDALPGENPDDCLRSQNADKITQLSNVVLPGLVTDGAVTDGAVSDGDITDGDVTDGAITDGAISYGDITNVGARINVGTATVFVNGKEIK